MGENFKKLNPMKNKVQFKNENFMMSAKPKDKPGTGTKPGGGSGSNGND